MDVEVVVIIGAFAVLLSTLAFFVRYDNKRREEAYKKVVEDSIPTESSAGPWPFPTGNRPIEKKSTTKTKVTKKEVKKTNRKSK